MSYLTDHMYANFKMHFPLDANKAVYYEPIGYDCLEIKLNNGGVVIYDDYNRSIRDLPGDSSEMSEAEFRREFGYRLRRIMEHKHVVQAELSERSGIAQCHISEYINGKRTPSSYTLGKLAKVLRCDINDFIYR